MTALNTDKFKKVAPNTGWQLGASGISDAAVNNFALVSASGIPTGTGVILTVDRVDASGAKTADKMERVLGVMDGDTVKNCIRGVGGTAQAHSGGAVVEILIDNKLWNDLMDGILVEHEQLGTHKKATGVEVNAGTEEGKLLTPKSIFDSYLSNQYFGMARQALINGNFDVWQRATSFVAGANNNDVYTADRWNLISDGNDAVDISQETTEVPEGSSSSMKLDVETSKRFGIVQFLEFKDAKKLKGKTVSLSFKVKSANISAIRAAVLSWAGTADTLTSDIVSAWADNPTWAANWTEENVPADLAVTSEWTTVKIEGIVLDSATINNLAIALWLPNQETIGDIIYISQIQLNVGSIALPFQPKSYEEELRACQRYYEYDYGNSASAWSGATLSGATFISSRVGFMVAKRISPTMTIANGTQINFPAAASTVNAKSVNGFTLQRAANATAGLGYFIDTWKADAEL